MPICTVCPRSCGVDRESKLGYCNSPSEIYISKAMLHKWEEPCISGVHGAGAIFFSGCNLHCVYCQNQKISRGQAGFPVSEAELEDILRKLCDEGAECVEFVTPTHYTDKIRRVLEKIKPTLKVPVVWNSGGYEKIDALRTLDGLVDIYLPDFKYSSGELAEKYSHAGDYPEIAAAAVSEMHRQTGKPLFDGKKLLRGTLVRHLVLPGCRKDSMMVLRTLANICPPDELILSLMSQYTPDFYSVDREKTFKDLCRKVTSFEYDSVLEVAEQLGFSGYFQKRASADKKYTPDF